MALRFISRDTWTCSLAMACKAEDVACSHINSAPYTLYISPSSCLLIIHKCTTLLRPTRYRTTHLVVLILLWVDCLHKRRSSMPRWLPLAGTDVTWPPRRLLSLSSPCTPLPPSPLPLAVSCATRPHPLPLFPVPLPLTLISAPPPPTPYYSQCVA
jgi:hypothetical protein